MRIKSSPPSSRSGKIRAQMVALLLLILSVSLILSAFRSLGREFDGRVVSKNLENGVTNSYWVFLAPVTEAEIASSAKVIEALANTLPTRRVGVSSLVYQDANLLQRVSKQAFSPFIFLDADRHIDLGMAWLLLGILGIIAAGLAYRQSSGTRTGDFEELLTPPLVE